MEKNYEDFFNAVEQKMSEVLREFNGERGMCLNEGDVSEAALRFIAKWFRGYNPEEEDIGE